MSTPAFAKNQKKIARKQPKSKPDGIQECRKNGCNSSTAGHWGNLKGSGAKVACASNCLTMKSKCELNDDDINKNKSDKEQRHQLLKKRRKSIARLKEKGKISDTEADKANTQNPGKNPTPTWKHKHCKGLIVKPHLDGLKDKVEQLETDINNKIIDIQAALLDGLLDKGVEVLQDKSLHLATRTGVRHSLALFGGPLATFTEAIAGVITVADAVYTTVTVPMDIYDAIEQLENKLLQYQKLKVTYGKEIAEFNEHIKLKERVKQQGIESLEPGDRKQYQQFKEKVDKQLKDLTNTMIKKAANSPCIQAKRCQLVSYEDSRTKSSNMSSTGGCCPGQTGHHLLPKSYFTKDNCPGYQEKKAPCICVEGINQWNGSHAKMHQHQDRVASDLIKNGFLTYDDAKESAIFSVKETFKPSCAPECLEKQLDDYHLGACGNPATVYPASTLKSGQLLDGAEPPTTQGGSIRR